MKSILLTIICLSFPVFSDIIYGNDTLDILHQSMALHFDFESDSKTIKNRNVHTDRNFYTCTTNVEKNDLVVMDNQITICNCPCRQNGGFGTFRPFYFIKNGLGSLNFNNTLDLNDTSKFTKIDTVRNFLGFNGCYIPFTVIYSNTIDLSYIIETHKNNYVIIKVDTLDTTFIDPWCAGRPQEITILKGFKITWYLQTNGTVNFNGIDITNTKRIIKTDKKRKDYQFKVGIAKTIYNKSIKEIYMLNGISIKKKELTSKNQLILYK